MTHIDTMYQIARSRQADTLREAATRQIKQNARGEQTNRVKVTAQNVVAFLKFISAEPKETMATQTQTRELPQVG